MTHEIYALVIHCSFKIIRPTVCINNAHYHLDDFDLSFFNITKDPPQIISKRKKYPNIKSTRETDNEKIDKTKERHKYKIHAKMLWLDSFSAKFWAKYLIFLKSKSILQDKFINFNML